VQNWSGTTRLRHFHERGHWFEPSTAHLVKEPKGGSRLIPVDELERYLAERREEARATRRRARPGRKSGLDRELVARIRSEYASGRTLGEIARQLNARDVPTAQAGRRWWPSTVRAVLVRSTPPLSAERG
jgi:hypothetical protein